MFVYDGKHTFIHDWDWKASPNIKKCIIAGQVLGKIELPSFVYDINTGGDEEAVVISGVEITQEQADEIYRLWDEDTFANW